MGFVKYTAVVRDGVYGWRYRLEAEQSLNRKSLRRGVEGFLVRTDGGFGCVQPWAEFGHEAIDEQWAALREGKSTTLIESAFACARCDGQARREGRSWWREGAVPKSHATITDLESQAATAWSAGFSTWKIKASIETGSEILACLREYPALRVRLDWNEVPSADALLQWLSSIPREALDRIDFMEDPFAYDLEAWRHFSQHTRIRLAQDRSFPQQFDADVALGVWKPAWTSGIAGIRADSIIVTSAMDHPVGQCWAALQASEISCSMLCGLRTDHLFARDAFTERMGVWSPDWPMLSGTGMGFDDLLENLPWTRLR